MEAKEVTLFDAVVALYHAVHELYVKCGVRFDSTVDTKLRKVAGMLEQAEPSPSPAKAPAIPDAMTEAEYRAERERLIGECKKNGCSIDLIAFPWSDSIWRMSRERGCLPYHQQISALDARWRSQQKPAEPAVIENPFTDRKRAGLYRKFNVTRTDGKSSPGEKHENCRYFVLDLDHDKFAPPAIEAYAKACKDEFPALAEDLAGFTTAKSAKPQSNEAEDGEVMRIAGAIFNPHNMGLANSREIARAALRRGRELAAEEIRKMPPLIASNFFVIRDAIVAHLLGGGK